MSHSNITADELFARLSAIAVFPDDGKTPNKAMHDILELTCTRGTDDNEGAFGNLFSKVDFLCRRHRLNAFQTLRIQRMRRDSNHSEPIPKERWGDDCRALALFISGVFSVGIPDELTRLLPHDFTPDDNLRPIDYKYIRCIITDVDSSRFTLTVSAEGESEWQVDCSAEGLRYIVELARKGMQLNLIDSRRDENGALLPSLIVVEPDFTVNISTLAGCFMEYGRSPFNYLLKRMQPSPNSQAILMGNFAGSALDDIIHTKDHYKWTETLKTNFKEQVLNYCTCPDFNATVFKSDAQRQARNIQGIVEHLFNPSDPHSYRRDLAILEPSFVCEQLGVYGRVDLMTTDLRMLVEQKSGKNFNIECGRPDINGRMQLEKHYAQLLLYFGVLRCNFGITPQKADLMLLYSRYPFPYGLLRTAWLASFFNEIMQLRNRIVALEFAMAREGFDRYLDAFTTDNLNIAGISGRFWDSCLKRQIDAVTIPLHQLSPLEREYITTMTTFVLREEIMSKTGAQQNRGNSTADLWNMPLAEKQENGSIFTALTITNMEQSDTYNGYDTLTLHVPNQGDDFLPNIRLGDSVYLYAYDTDKEPDVRHAVLFPGNVTALSSDSITVHLKDGQQNPDIFAHAASLGRAERPCLYAVEKSNGEMGTSSALAAMLAFAKSDKLFRDLLLGQRAPHANPNVTLRHSYNPYYDRIILKAMQATDYFLLVGPPGTGKTSMALQYIVREYEGQDILLMAYTNRAVDEICGMLEENGFDYLRIGNPYTCDERYRDHLLQNAVNEGGNLQEIRSHVVGAHIVVGTTTSVQSSASLFQLKAFSCAIIDEASQILEPSLIGLLARVPKFILIGDYKQLPAVVQQPQGLTAISSPLLHEAGFSDCRESLFQRLMRKEMSSGRTDFTAVLNHQGRMHTEIADFANQMFYSEEHLQCVPLPHQQGSQIYPDGCTAYTGSPIGAFIATRRNVFIPSRFCIDPNLSDKVNADEARITANVVEAVRHTYGPLFDPDHTIGVIVPYRNQIAMVRRLLEQTGDPLLTRISIDTVERYQGSQRDIIVYSFTVQHRYQLDFLTASNFFENNHEIDRKLNVALTRARRQMIVTGNEKIMGYNPIFKALIEYIKSKNGYLEREIG
ncbi:MAG: AAA domain-containing protein [Prevotella sp.]|jgi:hypothetical protein